MHAIRFGSRQSGLSDDDEEVSSPTKSVPNSERSLRMPTLVREKSMRSLSTHFTAKSILNSERSFTRPTLVREKSMRSVSIHSTAKSKSCSQRNLAMPTLAREKSMRSLATHSIAESKSIPDSERSLTRPTLMREKSMRVSIHSTAKSKSCSQRNLAMPALTREKSMRSLATHSTAESKSFSQKSLTMPTSARQKSMRSLSTHSTADSSPSPVSSSRQQEEGSSPTRRIVRKKKPVTPPETRKTGRLNPQEDVHCVAPTTFMTPKTKVSVIDASLPIRSVPSSMFVSPMTPTASTYDSSAQSEGSNVSDGNCRRTTSLHSVDRSPKPDGLVRAESNSGLGVADYSARSGSGLPIFSEGHSRGSSINAKTPTRSNDTSNRSTPSSNDTSSLPAWSNSLEGHFDNSSPRKLTRGVTISEGIENAPSTSAVLHTPKTSKANFPPNSFTTPYPPATPSSSFVDQTHTLHVNFTPGSSQPRRPVRRNSGDNIQGLLEHTDDLMDKMMNSGMTCLYECATKCDWDRVLHECRKYPRDAQFVCPRDGTTALHLAVMSRANPLMRDGELENYEAASLEVIDELLCACPEAAIMRCSIKKYTPLMYACLVSDRGYDMEDGAEMVGTILDHAPESAYVFTEDGFSALDIHILSYSRFHEEKQEIFTGVRTSSVIIKTLLTEKPALADPRSYKHKVRGPLELLYRCNRSEFEDAMQTEIGSGDPICNEKMKQRCASVATGVLADWWAFKWSLLLLKFSFQDKKNSDTPFSAVQAAARIVGCPLPILALVVHTFPEQVLDRDPRDDIYNLPLHEVCSWRCDAEIVSGDPFVIRRKAKAIRCLLSVNLDAARMTNNLGETPLQLAIESCTPWDGGLEDLVSACPKGLRFPRKLRDLPDEDGYAFSTSNNTSALSVRSDDSFAYDTVSAIDGMYPFLLAAVMSYVPMSRRNPSPLFYSDETLDEHENNLAQKDLESVRSIFGLLRANPDMLGIFRKDVSKTRWSS